MAHRRTEHYIILYYIALNHFFLFTSYCNLARIRDSIFINQANELDDHYPLTCTQNGVWMLGNLNTCRFLPLPGGEAKSSNLMMFYEGKKSMSMISWSRNGTQAN